MLQFTEMLAVKMPVEMAKAIKRAEEITGANRSEIAREAIALGLRQAVLRRQEQTKKSRLLLDIATPAGK